MPKRARNYRVGQLQRLKDPAYAAEYINAAIEAGDQPALLLALRNVAEARGVNATARGAGLSRESVYRMLSETGNPCYTSLLGILDALGLQLKIQPTGNQSAESFPWNWEDTQLLWEPSDRPCRYLSNQFDEFVYGFRETREVETSVNAPQSETAEVLALVA